jgi:lysyl-tRNA synthetase class 1
MTYAPIESLLYYLFLNPKKQRRLYFDVIPKSVDDYLSELRKYPELDETRMHDSVVWHIDRIGRPVPAYTGGINFSLALNLISGIGAGDRELLKDYLKRYDPEVDRNEKVVDKLVDRAVRYFKDFIEPFKKYRGPTEDERAMFQTLLEKLEAYDGDEEGEMQAMVFDAARDNGADPKDFFRAIYEVLLGQERGPRFGTFAKLVGKDRAAEMIREKLG